jgi:signal transduction histidine kinase
MFFLSHTPHHGADARGRSLHRAGDPSGARHRRNPLTVVASYADLLRIDGAVSGDHLLYVEEIYRTARFMAEMVEELLDAARLESGHADLDLQELDLVTAARHAATINRMGKRFR